MVIVEGEKTRMGVGNDLFADAKSISRIICPAKNAFDKYDEIIDTCRRVSRESVFVIALGPTATVLAYDLGKEGYFALDLGHIDIQYEYYLRKVKKKVAIPGKYVNEVSDGRNPEDIDNQEYYNSIITTIL